MDVEQGIAPKKEALLVSGKTLILSKGFTATPIDEICEKAEVTKGAFFYYFKNKEAFAQALLEHIWAPIEKMQATVMEDEVEPLQHLYQHIDHMVVFLPGDGRLIGLLNQELAKKYPRIGAQCRGYFRQWTQYLEQIIEVAKSRYAPSADFAPKEVMEFVIATIEGVPAISGQLGTEAVEHTVRHLKRYLRSLFDIKP